MVPAHNRFAVVNAMVLVAALIAIGPVAVTAIGHRTAGHAATAGHSATANRATGNRVIGHRTDELSVASCTVSDLDQAAGKAAATGFTLAECAQGWGLAAGPKYLDLFHQKQGRWAVVDTGSPDGLSAWSPAEFASAGHQRCTARTACSPLLALRPTAGRRRRFGRPARRT